MIFKFIKEDESDNERIKIVTCDSPWGMISEKDTVYGFNYEIARSYADYDSLELEMSIENNLQKCLEDLEKGKVDIVAVLIPADIFITERFNVIPIGVDSRLVLVQSQDSAVKRVESAVELANDQVTLAEGSPYKQRLLNLSDEIADTIKIIELEDLSMDSVIHLVAMGTYTKTICPEFMTAYYHSLYPGLDFSVPVGFLQEYVWISRKDDQTTYNNLIHFMETYLISIGFINLRNKYLNNN